MMKRTLLLLHHRGDKTATCSHSLPALLTSALRQEEDAPDGHDDLRDAHDHEGQVEAAQAQDGAAGRGAEQLGDVHEETRQALREKRESITACRFDDLKKKDRSQRSMAK